MTYKCPKGHLSTDADYCSECGALIGQSKLSELNQSDSSTLDKVTNTENQSGEICPDCGTPRAMDARFCEVCRHDFKENKTGVAEAIVASQKITETNGQEGLSDAAKEDKAEQNAEKPAEVLQDKAPGVKVVEKDEIVTLDKLNVVIAVDQGKAASCDIETSIKPDSVERVFPLDLNENLVGRRSSGKGIYPEIEINDPGVSHRHLKFIKETDGSFSVLELGSANGTELNGAELLPGVKTPVKSGDQFAIGIWTLLRIETR